MKLAAVLLIVFIPLCSGNILNHHLHLVQKYSTSVKAINTTVQSCRREVYHCLQRLENGKECDILPTPRRSFPKPIPIGSFELKLLRPGVWEFNNGIYNLLIVFYNSRLIIVDLPSYPLTPPRNSQKPLVVQACESILNGKNPRRIDMVYTHAHFDHMDAAGAAHDYFSTQYPKAHIHVWGSQESFELIRNVPSRGIPLPTVIVSDKKKRTITLSRSTRLIISVLGAHTQEDLSVYIPRYKNLKGIVMFVDVMFPGWVPGTNLDVTKNVRKYLLSQETLLKLPLDVIVPGHISLATKKDLKINIQYTKDVLKAAQNAVKSTTPEELEKAGSNFVTMPNRREFGNLMLSVEIMIKLQTEKCFKPLLEKWGCYLAGLDVTGRSHCQTAIFYLGVEA